MLNVSLISLNVASLMTGSPFLSISNFKPISRNFVLYNSHFSNFFSHVIYSHNIKSQNMIIQSSKFKYTLKSAISISGEKKCQTGFWSDYEFTGKPIKGVNISSDDFDYNQSTIKDIRTFIFCPDGETIGDVTIAGSVFMYCYAYDYNGGAISIEQNRSVLIHETLFIGCSTKKKGGALYIVLSGNGGYDDPQDNQIPKLDVQYCCFQDCFALNDKDNNYGVAMYSAALNTTLFYASTVNCSDVYFAKGAQFDLQAVLISSKFVNVTGGKANSTAGIEYRRVTEGFFRYQSIYKLDCHWATAFIYTNIKDLNLEYSNYIENTICNYDIYDSALIFIKQTNITIKNFYFYGTNFKANNSKIVSREKDELTVELINCFISDFDDSLISGFTTSNCYYSNDFTIYPIAQLNLGGCRGEKTADALIITSKFSPSNYFSKSDVFSETAKFTKSSQFRPSNYFSKSDVFSETAKFTKSSQFKPSNYFSKSDVFSETTKFTKSSQFTSSAKFLQTSGFTKSSQFSASDYIPGTRSFTLSSKFTKSDEFSKSNQFSKSYKFTSSNDFSVSNVFTNSNIKTTSQTSQFSNSLKFTKSSSFTASLHDVHIVIGDSTEKDVKMNSGAVAGIVVAIAAVAGGVFLAVMLINKRKKLDIDAENAELETGNSESLKSTFDNPLYDNNNNAVDDPFANDFDEVENVYTF